MVSPLVLKHGNGSPPFMYFTDDIPIKIYVGQFGGCPGSHVWSPIEAEYPEQHGSQTHLECEGKGPRLSATTEHKNGDVVIFLQPSPGEVLMCMPGHYMTLHESNLK